MSHVAYIATQISISDNYSLFMILSFLTRKALKYILKNDANLSNSSKLQSLVRPALPLSKVGQI